MRIAALEAFGIEDEIVDLWNAAGHKELLPVQVKAIKDHGVLEGRNVLVFSPTSSGKTFVGEMAAARLARKGQRVLYLVPQKALAEEKFRSFRAQYGSRGIKVVVSTRDRKLFDRDIKDGKFHIAVVVFEKMQNLLVSQPTLLNGVGLVVIDELQLIGDRERGADLEILLTKIKTTRKRPQLIGLSAVLGNSDELASWLGSELCSDRGRPVELRKGTLHCGNFRYIEHNTCAEGTEKLVPAEDNVRIERLLARQVKAFVEAGEQCIVFCKSKRDSLNTAKLLARNAGAASARSALAEIQELEDSRGKNILAFLLDHGTAFHNADLDRDQRDLIERHFRSGEIKVLAATTTLAMGVNLPARNVFIDPERWDRGDRGFWGKEPITPAEFENMSGRAGRLGLEDEFGRAIILTENRFDADVNFDVFIKAGLGKIEPALDKGDMADHILNLVASGLCRTEYELREMFLSSFTGEIKWKTEGKRADFEKRYAKGFGTCLSGGLIEKNEEGVLGATGLGRITASKGITVKTALKLTGFTQRLAESSRDVHEFEMLCTLSCSEDGDRAYINLSTKEHKTGLYLSRLKDAVATLPERTRKRFECLDKTFSLSYEKTKQVKRSLLLHEWLGDDPTPKIEERYYTYSGAIVSIAREFAWLAEALADITKECGWHDADVERVRVLSTRLIHGVAKEGAELTDIRVRGLGRSRISKLIDGGLDTLQKIADGPREFIEKLVTKPVAAKLIEQCRFILAHRAEVESQDDPGEGAQLSGNQTASPSEGATYPVGGEMNAAVEVAELGLHCEVADPEISSLDAFRKVGEMWSLAFEGKSLSMKSTKGLVYLAHLIKHSGQRFHASQLYAHGAGRDGALVFGPAGDVVDEETIESVKNRLLDLESRLEDSAAAGDLGNQVVLQTEVDALKSLLASATGLGGKKRKGPNGAEKVRKSVCMAISRALDNIRKPHPELCKHLRKSVHMGRFLMYDPEIPRSWLT